jgi:hypothetical protein
MFQPVVHHLADLGPVIAEDGYPDQNKNARKQTRADEQLAPSQVCYELGNLNFH